MRTITTAEIPANTGWAATVVKGQVVRISAASGIGLVCFNAADLNERFDQARTKVYNMRLWITAGEQLFSKLNNPMMTMIVDMFADIGRHDLQYGMCSGPILAHAAATGEPRRYAHAHGKSVPGHGCHENLTTALAPWGIAAEQVPMPLNLFQHTEIDTASGTIAPAPLRPHRPLTVELRAEMDLVLALSACPDLEAPGGARSATVALVDAPAEPGGR